MKQMSQHQNDSAYPVGLIDSAYAVGFSDAVAIIKQRGQEKACELFNEGHYSEAKQLHLFIKNNVKSPPDVEKQLTLTDNDETGHNEAREHGQDPGGSGASLETRARWQPGDSSRADAGTCG